MSTRKLTAKETVEHIRRQAQEHRVEEARSVTNEQAEKELEAEGVDVDAARKRFEARVGGHEEKKAPTSNVIPFRRRLARDAVVAVGSLAAAAITVFYLGTSGLLLAVFAPASTGTYAPPVQETPAELRHDAFAECGQEHWQKCIDLFNLAQTMDQQSNGEEGVAAARMRATKALAAMKDGGN